mgnify:CR=1 FL=1
MNILVFGMLVFVVGLAMTKGILLPANYAEWAIEQVKEEIASIEEFDESLANRYDNLLYFSPFFFQFS